MNTNKIVDLDLQKITLAVKEKCATLKKKNIDYHTVEYSLNYQLDCPIEWMSIFVIKQKAFVKSSETNKQYILLGGYTIAQGRMSEYEYLSNVVEKTKESFDHNIYGGVSFCENSPNKEMLCEELPEVFFYVPFIEIEVTKTQLKFKFNFKTQDLCASFSQSIEPKIYKWLKQKPLEPCKKLKVVKQTHNPTFEGWCTNVQRALEGIERNEYEKIVLFCKTSIEFSVPINSFRLVKKLIDIEPNCSVFFQQFDTNKTFVSVSPEKLFVRRKQNICVDVIAGTKKLISPDHVQQEDYKEFLDNKKNKHEHQCVMDFLVEKCSRLATDVNVKYRNKLLLLSKLVHLKSQIEAIVKPHVSDFDIIQLLHPTPATGGLPQQKALAKIQDIETVNRSYYAGVFGYTCNESAEFIVGLRSCLLDSNYIHMFSGAGIVQGSDATEEWNEVLLKIDNYLDILNP